MNKIKLMSLILFVILVKSVEKFCCCLYCTQIIQGHIEHKSKQLQLCLDTFGIKIFPQCEPINIFSRVNKYLMKLVLF